MRYSLGLDTSKKIQDVSMTSETTENVYEKEINDMNRINSSNSIIKNESIDGNSLNKKKKKKKNFMKIFKKKRKKSKNLKGKDFNINDDSNYLFSNINNVDSKKYFLSFNELSKYDENLDRDLDNEKDTKKNSSNNTKNEKNKKINDIDKKDSKISNKRKEVNKEKINSQNNYNERYDKKTNNEYNIDENYNFELNEDLKKELEKIKTDIDQIKKKGNLRRMYDDLKYILLFQNEIIDTLIDDIRKNKLKTKYDLFDDCTIKGDVNKMILNQITLDLLKFKYVNTKLKELIMCIYDTKKFNSLIRKIIYNNLDEMRKLVGKDGELSIAKSMLIFLYKQLKYCLEEEVQSYYNNVKNINDDIHNIKKNILNIIFDSINDVCSLPDPYYIYNTNEEECIEIKKSREKKLMCPVYANDLNNIFYLYNNIYSEENSKEVNQDNFKNYCFKNNIKGNCENSNIHVLNKNENTKFNVPLRDMYKSYITNDNYENVCSSVSYANHLNNLNGPYINESICNNNNSHFNNIINNQLPLNIYGINKNVNHPYYYFCNLKKKKEDYQGNIKNISCNIPPTYNNKIYDNPLSVNKNIRRMSNNNNILMYNENGSLLNHDINKKNSITHYMKCENNYDNTRNKKCIIYDKHISNDNNNNNNIRIYDQVNYKNQILNNIWNDVNNKIQNDRNNDIHEENINIIKKKEYMNKGDEIMDIYEDNNNRFYKNNKISNEMKYEKSEMINKKNMYTGFEIISSKEEMKKLENFLNDKWGSFKLFEKWISDCSKWQWIDLKLQREQINDNIKLEKLKEEKKKYLEKCINNKIKELWCGRMKGLMTLKLCDIEKKITKSFSSNIVSQNVKDVILDLERNTMCFEDLYAKFISKEVYNKKLNLLKKYNEYKDKNKHDKGNFKNDKEKIFLGSNSENIKYIHKKKGYVKSLIYSFNKKSQKSNNKYNSDLKKNSELCNKEKNIYSIKGYTSPTYNKSIEKNENNNDFKINYKGMEVKEHKIRDNNSYMNNRIEDYEIIKNRKFYSFKDNISLNKIEYIKKDSNNYDKKKYSNFESDSSSSILKTKSNITQKQDDSFEYSRSIEKDKYEKKKKHRKSNMSTLKKFFNLKRKKKKKEKKNTENFLLDIESNSKNANKDYHINRKKDIIYSTGEKVENISNTIAHDELHSLDKNKCDKERKTIINQKGDNIHPYIKKKKIKLIGDLFKEEKCEIYDNSSIQNNRYLNDFNKLHILTTEKEGNKTSYSSNGRKITRNNEMNGIKLKLNNSSKGKNEYLVNENNLNKSNYVFKNSYSFEENQENSLWEESLKNYKINENFNKSNDTLKKTEEEKKYSFEFDVTNIKKKLSEDNLPYDYKNEEVKNIEKKSSLTYSNISYSTIKEDNKYEKYSSLDSIKKKNKKNKLNKFFKNLGKFNFKSSKKVKKKENNSDEIILDDFSTVSNSKSDKNIYREKLEKKDNNDDYDHNTSKSFLTNSDLSNKNSLGKSKMNMKVDKIYSYINKLKEKKKSINKIDINHNDESLNNYNADISLNKKGEYEKKELKERIRMEEEEDINSKYEKYEYAKENKSDGEYENIKSKDKKELYNNFHNDDAMKKFEKKSKKDKKEKNKNTYDNYCSSSNKNVDLNDNNHIIEKKKKKHTKIGYIIKNDNNDVGKIRSSSDNLSEKKINSSKLSPRFGYSLSNVDFSKNNENTFNNSSNFDRLTENISKNKKKKNEEIKKNKDENSIKLDESGNVIDKKEKKKKKKFVVTSSFNDLNKNKNIQNIKENIDVHKGTVLSNDMVKYKIDDDSLYNNIYFEETSNNLKDISKSFLNDKNSSSFYKKNQKREENSSNSHEIIRLSSFKSRSDTNAIRSDDQKLDVLSCGNASCNHNTEVKKEDYSYYKYVQSILPFGILSQKEHSDADSQISGKLNASEKFS
ncbi:conserved Plasmodium protein, unknown function [Plasmodium gallinaceum]|uniref:Uncharacterized protein n=1 Tax=Plasmodium gallinaceum TaxID=5849 RepID=A0A1J1H2F8_PLAGA|nr:conserved Plasmodium protein, unknown function [Plasmodium gallinaceum]CRG97518.1 conserved Plasmodium protein, unknown function [Plasmodium gallinaceum]